MASELAYSWMAGRSKDVELVCSSTGDSLTDAELACSPKAYSLKACLLKAYSWMEIDPMMGGSLRLGIRHLRGWLHLPVRVARKTRHTSNGTSKQNI